MTSLLHAVEQLPAIVARAISACAIATFSPIAAADDNWDYLIGEPRVAQQANFCANRDEALRIVAIVEDSGLRAAFEALTTSPHCEIAVRSFTPRAVIAAATVAPDESAESTLSVIEVIGEGDEVFFLLSTRAIR